MTLVRLRHLISGGGLAVLLAAATLPVGARQATTGTQAASAACRITGKVTSGSLPLPGVTIVVRAGDQIVAVTSTEIDGRFVVTLATGREYRVTTELTAFVAADRTFTTGEVPCAVTVDLSMAIAGATLRSPAPAPAPAGIGARPATRFESLDVQAGETAAASLEVNPPNREATEAATRLLLPPGFSTEGPVEAVAMNGNAANIDRGMLNDRLRAFGRGEISATDPAAGFGAPGLEGGQGPGGRGGPGGPGGRGGPGAPGGRGGAGGRIGGRGFQQRPYNFTTNYTFGGSALDAAPYQLRSDTPAEKRPYARQTFGGRVGGPVRLPGVYNGTGRTNFQFSYSGNRSGNLFDQFATVPSEALRAGDFSAIASPIIDPATGQPFPGGRIPADRLDPAALTLLAFIPAPNLEGDTRNFRYTTTRNTDSDAITVRVTQTLVGAAGGGRGGRGAGPAGGGRGGAAGRGGRAGTTASVNAQVQYRRNASESVNVFPTLGGRTVGSTLAVPAGLNIQRGRVSHAVNVNYSRSTSRASNQYAFLQDVAGAAGIGGVSADPFDWGVPNLSFATFSNVRDTAPTDRSDTRFSLSYSMTRPVRTHTLRWGVEYARDRSSALTNANARGSFVFTGLYTSGGGAIVRGGARDFADFLLGLPQQASIAYGPGRVQLVGRSLSGYFQDDWRKSGGLTFNLGVRYDLVWPYTEANGQMVNLDAADGFTAVAPVLSNGVGPYSGLFPAGLVRTDGNNIAPRVGVAWRAAPGTIVRAGYGVTYNSGSYASIARQLVGQPPFATTNTSAGTLLSPLSFDDPFALTSPTTTTNNYGIDRDYVLGLIQSWNVDLSRDLGPWNVGASYIGTKGSDLDLLRAPNRGASGLLLAGVQAFTWQAAEGRSILKAGSFRLRRRPVAGIGFGATYTLAKSMDNTTATGGAATVAQDDRNLDAEWAVSAFDRRHQLSADVSVELPFGPNRRWLNGDSMWSKIAGGWRASATLTWQSGTPYTPTVTGSVGDVAGGTNGARRADYSGDPIQIANPTIDQFFNTAAFSVPASTAFGTAGRNLIIGPGSRALNATFSRDVVLGNNRTITVDVRANNLLNLVNYTGIDTRVNSPTFGQVTSVSGMRSVQLNLRVRF